MKLFYDNVCHNIVLDEKFDLCLEPYLWTLSFELNIKHRMGDIIVVRSVCLSVMDVLKNYTLDQDHALYIFLHKLHRWLAKTRIVFCQHHLWPKIYAFCSACIFGHE